MLGYLVSWFLYVKTIAEVFYRISTKYNIHVKDCRRFEKINNRIVKSRCDILFLQECIDKGLVPKFLQLRDKNNIIPQHQLKRNQLNKVNQLIKQHKNHLKRLFSNRKHTLDGFHQKLSSFDFLLLTKAIIRENLKLRTDTIERQNRKLQQLWLQHRFTTPKNTVTNFSKHEISQEQLSLLSTGLNTPINPNSKDLMNLRTQMEKVVTIQKDLNTDTMTSNLSHLLRTYGKQIANTNKRKENKSMTNVIKSLSRNHELKIIPYDKGNGTAIMDKTDYLFKLHNIVDDDSKFKKIEFSGNDLMTNHPVISDENKLKYFLNKYVKPFVDNDTFNFINPNGSQPGKLYGAAKIHKDNVPVRPILASYSTAQYNLAKYLNKFISPVIPTKFSVNKNVKLLERLSGYNFTPNSKLVSFDIESLFTNVPLEETIDLATNLVYDSNSNSKPPFGANTFKKLLYHATSGIFSFDQSLYRQIDGLAMGSPLAPTLSNLFIGVLEHKFLHKSMLNVKLYVRFVDDILAVFEDQDHETFHNYLNSWHKNMNFTVEVGDKKIPFLDIDINVENAILETEVYRKPTNTNLLLNFDSCVPKQWKRGLVQTLLNRAYNVCSNWIKFNTEVDKLVDILRQNGYPTSFVLNLVRDFLDKKISPTCGNIKEEIQNCLIVKIPYFGFESLQFRKQLGKILKRAKLQDKVKIVFTVKKLRSCFSLKDSTPKILKANVVYLFTCGVDPSIQYIGKTSRHLAKRIKEHRSRISAIHDHRLNCQCSCDPDNFSILDTAQNEFALRIKEAIYIRQNNPVLNKQLSNSGSYYFSKLNHCID